MYRDREKQKIAVREAVRRFRSKGITQGITETHVIPSDVIPSPVIPVIPLVTIENVKRIVAGLPKRDWRTPKVVGCRRFGESPEAA
jgi:hypothetical protein